ncbi:MAG: hypothetical protein LN415_08790 [Candidatus Thermoplasmatota archaeon]|nr:hypothetical protein [Candidatus Thermoplasmatota archaeon]
MVERLRFRPKARGILCVRPLWNALPIHRVFYTPSSERDVFVDRMDDIRALMTVGRLSPRIVSMAGTNEKALRTLLDDLEGREGVQVSCPRRTNRRPGPTEL